MGPIRVPALMAAIFAAGLLLGSPAWAGGPAGAQSAAPDGARAAPSEFSAQQRTQETQPPRQRARTRVRVTRPRPLGPNAYRECVAWYEQEYRPSGTVVVPKQRCWWVNPR